MPERLKAILDKITAWWKKFNTKQRSVLISIVAVVIVALVILGVVISRPTQVELVEAQSASEASTIKGVLEDNNISYEVDSKLVFFVNKSDEVNAIMALGDNGIPAQAYSIDNVTDGSFSTTEADKQKKYQVYLEDKLKDHLEKQSYVNEASVDITMPDKDGTILKSKEEATAAVTLGLKDSITDDQAYAIARLVATALGNDTTKGITIIDIGSFMVNDKLSHKDLDKIADMSAEELKIITEKEVTAAKKDLSDALDEEITQKQDETKRSLEKEANSKIMAINEYSDTVLDSINKAHNEIMFLYSMLNDKHDELTRLSGDIDKASSRLRSSFEPLSADSAKRAEKPSVAVQKPAEPKSGTMQQDTKPDMKQMTGIDISGIIKTQPASAAPASKAGATTAKGTAAAVSVKASDAAFGTPAGSSANADVINHTHEILKLYKSGKSNVEIAKLLSLGTGEVKLIIDLYKEGK